MSSQIEVTERWSLPRGLIILLGVAAALVVALGMRQFSNILGPVLHGAGALNRRPPDTPPGRPFPLTGLAGHDPQSRRRLRDRFRSLCDSGHRRRPVRVAAAELWPTIPGLLAAGQSSPPVSRCQPGEAPRLCERAQPKQTGWGCEQPARRARRRIERHLLPHRAAVLHSRRRGRLRLQAETRPSARSAARPGI